MSILDGRKVPTVLLICDVPNLDMLVKKLMRGERPTYETRPDFGVLKQYFEDLYPEAQIVANAYVNTREDNLAAILSWAEGPLKAAFWNCYIKPKLNDDDDIDEKMVNDIFSMCSNDILDIQKVVVVSHDTSRFNEVLQDIAKVRKIKTAYCVFTEHLSPRPNESVEIIDLRDIRNISKTPWPDRRFSKIPAEGMWV